MVEPKDTNRREKVRRASAVRAAAPVCAGLTMALTAGCSLVPRAKLDECHRVTQTVRTENNRLKDVVLDLRSQNQDLSQRAVDDARKIAAQEEAVEHLEKSVQAYQAEREQMAAALEAVKRQVRVAVSPHAAAVPARLKAFAEAHPGWSFDEASMTLSAPSAGLFESGADRLKPEAADALKALASELSGPGADGLSLEVVGPPDGAPVAKAGFDGGDPAVAAASGRFLAAARGARVRERLVGGSGLDPARARLVPPARRPPDAPDDAERRVEIRVAVDAPAAPPAALPALDAAPAAHR